MIFVCRQFIVCILQSHFFFNIKSNENEKCTSFSMIFLSSLTTKRPTKRDEKHYFPHTFTKSCHDIEINKHHLSSDVIFRLSNLAEAFQPSSSPFSKFFDVNLVNAIFLSKIQFLGENPFFYIKTGTMMIFLIWSLSYIHRRIPHLISNVRV